MPLPSLPDECFSDIFSFLDDESLYKCLFVNRYYCKLSIPIIWKNPFTIPNGNSISLINTLISCLNEDEISSLIPCAIDLPSLNNQPLFEYGKFIRKIDHGYCMSHIMDWLELSDTRVLQDCRVQKLIDAIYHMIMRKGSNLQEFAMFLDSYRYDLPKFSTFTIYEPGITNLSTISLHDYFSNSVNYQNTIEFLSTVSEFCNSIINFEVRIDSFDGVSTKQILNIIKLQPLKRILLSGDHILNIEKTLYTLKEFRTETLKELLFVDINFQQADLSIITKLKFLERLEFVNCTKFTLKEKLRIRELKLCINYRGSSNTNDVKLHAVSTISLFCSEILHKLTLNTVIPETIKVVKENCRNIKFLCIEFASEKFFNVNLTIPLICELLPLKILNIKFNSFNKVDENLLIRSLCDHLKFVEELFLDFPTNLQNFEYFTNNCKVKLKRLNILVGNYLPSYLRKNYLVHVNNFQKVHNSLKIFGIKDVHKFNWMDEEMEIINSLKNQGTDVVSLYLMNY